ncbi:uncharacterized protein [Melopsittacus undulatus]|uniref:uncharacterized protein n=1 Tax=Melopsittacus undulatus TaxID=13146 RepID=UPI00146BBF55|nr:uncharacterized protein LOC117435927 [Melopsittacus undulatus]
MQGTRVWRCCAVRPASWSQHGQVHSSADPHRLAVRQRPRSSGRAVEFRPGCATPAPLPLPPTSPRPAGRGSTPPLRCIRRIATENCCSPWGYGGCGQPASGSGELRTGRASESGCGGWPAATQSAALPSLCLRGFVSSVPPSRARAPRPRMCPARHLRAVGTAAQPSPRPAAPPPVSAHRCTGGAAERVPVSSPPPRGPSGSRCRRRHPSGRQRAPLRAPPPPDAPPRRSAESA